MQEHLAFVQGYLGFVRGYLEFVWEILGIIVLQHLAQYFGARVHETRIQVLGVCNTIVTSKMLLNVM